MKISLEHANLMVKIIREAEQKLSQAIGRKIALIAKEQDFTEVDPLSILTVIAEALNMELEDFKNSSRQREYVDLRRLGAHFLRLYYPHLTLAEIGRYFDRDHSSVINLLETSKIMLDQEEVAYNRKFQLVHNAIWQWKEI